MQCGETVRPTGGLVSMTEELVHRPLVYSCVSTSVNAHVCVRVEYHLQCWFSGNSHPTLRVLFGFGNKVFLIGLELVDWIRLVHRQAPEVCMFLPP